MFSLFGRREKASYLARNFANMQRVSAKQTRTSKLYDPPTKTSSLSSWLVPAIHTHRRLLTRRDDAHSIYVQHVYGIRHTVPPPQPKESHILLPQRPRGQRNVCTINRMGRGRALQQHNSPLSWKISLEATRKLTAGGFTKYRACAVQSCLYHQIFTHDNESRCLLSFPTKKTCALVHVHLVSTGGNQ